MCIEYKYLLLLPEEQEEEVSTIHLEIVQLKKKILTSSTCNAFNSLETIFYYRNKKKRHLVERRIETQ